MTDRMYLSRRWLLAATCLQAGVTLSGAQASKVSPRNTLRLRIRGFTVTKAVVGMPIEASFTAIHGRAERLSGTIYLGILDEEFGFETFDLVAVELPASSPALVTFKNGPIPESAGRKWLEFRSENFDRVSFQVGRAYGTSTACPSGSTDAARSSREDANSLIASLGRALTLSAELRATSWPGRVLCLASAFARPPRRLFCA